MTAGQRHHVTVGGPEENPIQLEFPAERHEPGHDVGQAAKPRMLLPRKRRPGSRERGPGILEKKPLHAKHGMPRETPAIQFEAKLHQEMTPLRLSPDPHDGSQAGAGAEFHLGFRVPAIPKLGQDPEALELGHDIRAGEAVQEERASAGAESAQRRQVLPLQRPGKGVAALRWTRLSSRPRILRPPAPGPSEGHAQVVGWLLHLPRGQPGGVARRGPPGGGAVAPGQHDRQGGPHLLRHEAVPFQESGPGETPIAVAVVRARIHPGQVDGEARGVGLHHGGKGAPKELQVGSVLDPRPEGDGGIGHGVRRLPVLVVQRVGVHGGIVGEDRPGSVAVMQVQVHHQHRSVEASGPESLDRHGHVVQQAESRPPGRTGVMESSTEVEGDAPGPEREPHGLKRPAGGKALHGQRGPRLLHRDLKAQDPPHLLRALEGTEVVGRMHPQQVLQRGRAGRDDSPVRDPSLVEKPGQDPLAPHRVHGHPRQPPPVLGVVEEPGAAAPSRGQEATGEAMEPAERGHAGKVPTGGGHCQRSAMMHGRGPRSLCPAAGAHHHPITIPSLYRIHLPD